jgi:putative FmdB family regulatory protein
MPIYEYEHMEEPCRLGKYFEALQAISDEPLSKCPECGLKVRKVISFTNIKLTKTNSELRDLGFTKLVRRDDGVYENVTARGTDKKLVLRDRPETLPDISKTIND